MEDGWLIPVKSVGVQGDIAQLRAVLAIKGERTSDATELINRYAEINRVVAEVRTIAPVDRDAGPPRDPHRRTARTPAEGRCGGAPALRGIGFERKVWQFPVILIPFGTDNAPGFGRSAADRFGRWNDRAIGRDGRRICSTEWPTEILQVPGIAGVFYDLTHKPPGTIEWE